MTMLSSGRRRRALSLLSVTFLLPLGCQCSTSLATTSFADGGGKVSGTSLVVNIYAAASPLVVAAVCSDGVAMVAVHPQPDVVVGTSGEGSGSLLKKKDAFLGSDDTTTATTTTSKESSEDDNDITTTNGWLKQWKDLPKGHGGPFRIDTIDQSHLLLSVGWRADCDLLKEKLCSFASQEVAMFGGSGSGSGPQQQQGRHGWGGMKTRYLAQKASSWMAQLTVAEHLRPLSSVGLLVGASGGASVTSGEHGSAASSSLWLMDATGAYRMRAIAFGGGPAAASSDDQTTTTMVAQLVNAKLEKIDFNEMSAREGLICILKVLSGDDDDDNNNCLLVPPNCEMELAITITPEAGKRRGKMLKRLQLSEVMI